MNDHEDCDLYNDDGEVNHDDDGGGPTNVINYSDNSGVCRWRWQ